MSDIDLKQFFLEQVPCFPVSRQKKIEEILTRSRLATFEGNEAMPGKPVMKRSISGNDQWPC